MADDEPGPKPGLVPPQPSATIGDYGLRRWCEVAGRRIRGGWCASRIEGRVDLSGNDITDAGLAMFVDFLIKHKVKGITSLLVDDNRLQQPFAIVELLRDVDIGLLAGALFQVRLAEKETGCDFLWRFCETCCKIRDRHRRRFPLELVIVSRETLSGSRVSLSHRASCGGDLMRVLKSAEANGLKIGGYGFSKEGCGFDVTVCVLMSPPAAKPAPIHDRVDEAVDGEHANQVPGQQHTNVGFQEQPCSAAQQNGEDDVIRIDSEIQIVSSSGPWARFHTLIGWVIGFSDAGAYHIQFVDGNLAFSVAPNQCVLVSDSQGHGESDDDDPCGSQAADFPMPLPTSAHAGAASSSSAGATEYAGISAVGAAEQPITNGAKVQLKTMKGKGLAVINGEIAHVVNVIDGNWFDLTLESGVQLFCVSREYFNVVYECVITADNAAAVAAQAVVVDAAVDTAKSRV